MRALLDVDRPAASAVAELSDMGTSVEGGATGLCRTVRPGRRERSLD
jgi:hypothetical protein